MSACDCSICFDPIDVSTTGRVELSCRHTYHFSCIVAWFSELEKGTCPQCRKEMGPKEDIPTPLEEDLDEDSDDDSEDSEDSEEDLYLEISRADLHSLLCSLGGTGVTEVFATRFFPDGVDTTSLLHIDFNMMCLGNGARDVIWAEWLNICERFDPVVRLQKESEAALKIQRLWRGWAVQQRQRVR